MAQSMMLLASLECDEDLLLLSCMDDDKESSIYHKLGIDELSEEQFRILFRFKKEDIYALCDALGIPVKIVCKNRTVRTGNKGLCILIRRLAYPNRSFTRVWKINS